MIMIATKNYTFAVDFASRGSTPRFELQAKCTASGKPTSASNFLYSRNLPDAD